MPNVLRFLSYRAVIYPNDHRPCHVHVMNEEHEAVFELNCPAGPPALRENYGFRNATLNLIDGYLRNYLTDLCTRWREIHVHY